MTKLQIKNLVFSFILLFGTLILGFYVYQNHIRSTEEGLVYIGVFNPNPKIKEFKNIVALSNPTICRTKNAHYKGLPLQAIQDFQEANKIGASPIRLTILEGKVPIVRWKDTKRIHEKGVVKLFRPPNYRLLHLSRVGFNSEMTRAIVCIELSEGSFSTSSLIYLNKIDGKWKVIENRLIWIS